MDKEHKEIYINPVTLELDKRCKYKTIVVLDNIVVAEVNCIEGIKSVILNKDTFDCIHKSYGRTVYLDDCMVCSFDKGKATMVSRKGSVLKVVSDLRSIGSICSGYYLVRSTNKYSDYILEYNKRTDSLIEYGSNGGYMMFRSSSSNKDINIIAKTGGKFIYDVVTKVCTNEFSGEDMSIRVFQ